MQQLPITAFEKINAELSELDQSPVDINGERLKPSQCYHFETNPPHLLFNTNCPDNLKEKLKAIISKHIPSYESDSWKAAID